MLLGAIFICGIITGMAGLIAYQTFKLLRED
jgi:hypothetical protein